MANTLSRPKISVVIPTRNESRNIGFVLSALPPDIDEVVLVDGHSVDDTVAVARALRPDIVVVEQRRQGKGNALAAGFAAATGEYLVMIDADGSMDPGEIADFVAALDDGADYAKGTRFAAGGGSDDISLLRQVGNRLLNMITNLLFGTQYTDLCYGYNAFHRTCVDVFALPDPHDTTVDAHWGDGFEIETLINVRVAQAGMVITEVPSFEHARRFGVSNLRTFRDGARVLVTILRERFPAGAPQLVVQPAATQATPALEPAMVRLHDAKTERPAA
jgi:glycosyltransferase involved in cell wall biosynthesis